MVIKNIGRKIIGFGQTSVLPDQTVTIPDTYKSFVTDTYVALGIVEVVNTSAEKANKTGKGVKTSGKKTDNAETDSVSTDADGETEAGKE